MSGFMATFSGLVGEDPEDYLQDLDLYMKMQQPPGINADLLRQSVFRQGLYGRAREQWYYGLHTESRGDWKVLKSLFLTEFRVRPRRQLTEQVLEFKREPDESLSSFLRRADAVAKTCNQRQRNYMRDRLFYGMGCKTDTDRLVRGLLVARLDASGKLDGQDELLDSCTYGDVREVLEKTALSMGETIEDTPTGNTNGNLDDEYKRSIIQLTAYMLDHKQRRQCLPK